MATNKNANLRYHVLDKCLSNPIKKYFIQDLIDACTEKLLEIDSDSKGISRRQVLEDLKYMASEEGYKAIIDHLKDGKKTYYRYQDRNFSIDKQPLNQSELEQVLSAMNILSRFKGMPQFEWVNELSPKLEQAFLTEKQNVPIISFDNNSYLTGIEHLGPIFHHILYKKVLFINYQSFKSERPKTMTIHPYYLKQYNNRWFLIGLNAKFEKLSHLALDRIKELSLAPVTYQANLTYDFEEYFDDIIGVTLPENGIKEKIILRFNADAAPYMISKPLHHSQKRISYEHEILVITIEVIPNYELESLILSFGERVEVLEPPSFKIRIVERLKVNLDIYKNT